MDSINITYTDKKCHNNQHCGQVDGYHCLKIVLLVEVCAVADYIQNYGGNDDIEDNSEQLASQHHLHKHILNSAANRLIGEVVQSRRRPLLGPSPG